MVRVTDRLGPDRPGIGSVRCVVSRLAWLVFAVLVLFTLLDLGVSYACPGPEPEPEEEEEEPWEDPEDDYDEECIYWSLPRDDCGDDEEEGPCPYGDDEEEEGEDEDEPFAEAPEATKAPIYLRYGTVIEKARDLHVKGPTFSWGQVRTYDSHISGVATKLGGKWLSNSGDLKLREDVVDFVPVVRLILSASSQRVFEYWEDDEDSGYDSPGDSPLLLEHDEQDSEFILTNRLNDEVWIFYDFSVSHAGMLKERTTRGWRHKGRDGTVYTYNVDDTVSQITSPEGQDYNIVFTYDGDDNITEIEVRTGAGTSTRIKEVEYTYFDSQNHSSDLGADGDLVQVKTARLKTGGDPDTAADWIVRYTQYRYNSQGMLKAVFLPSAVQRIIDDRSDISAAGDILAKADDDDNSGAEDYKIKEYASRRFTYYTVDVKTDNSGAGTQQDPKCTTVWAPTAGENLQTTYGGTNVDETADGKYLVKSEIIGACSSCGGSVAGVTREYFYLQINHGTPDSNEVIRLVVEDTIDGDGNGVSRKVYGLSDRGRKLRQVLITDPTGSPEFWCKSWKFVEDTGAKLHRLEEYRTPAAHNVTSSTVDEFLDPSDNGDFTNDTNTLYSGDGVIYVYEYNGDGARTGTRVKQGRTGSAYYVSATDYYGGTNDYRKHLVTYRYKYPEKTTSRTAASRITTGYSYTFWAGTDNVKTITTTLPSIPTTQNGSGSSATAVRYYDEVGRLRWKKDPLGYVTYHSFHPKNGGIAYAVRDADPTSLPTSADADSSKWVTSSDASASSNKPTRGGGLPTAIEQVTFREFDSQGRRELYAAEDGTDGTVLSRHYTVYETNRTLKFLYWDTSTNRPLLPIEVRQTDDAGGVIETYTVDPARTASSGGKPTGLSAGTDQSHYLSWTRFDRDDLTGNPTKTHHYHDIPSSGYGTKDTNYAETVFGYDAMGRLDRVVSPGGTITRTVYDDIGRTGSTWIGTDDVPSSGDWSPTNNSGANMTKVVQIEYDGDSAGGNGNITKTIRYLTDDVEANARVTELKYDWRDRRVFTVDAEEYSSKVTYTRFELDNLGRTTKIERYYDADDDEDFPTDGTVDAGDRLLARTETLLDELGRVYRTKSYAVDPDDGAVGSCLVADTWRDAAGRAIKQQQPGSEAFTKTTYDGLGRAVKQYVGYDTDETAYTDADDVTGDTILAQTETDYDASGNVIQATRYARKHTASGAGALTTSTARVTYTAMWYDDADRQTDVADYGTNGGSAFSRPSSAPARSDTVLVTVRHGRPGLQDDRPRRPRRPPRVRRRRTPDQDRPELHRRQPLHGRGRRGRHRREDLQLRRETADAHRQEPDHRRPGDPLRLRHRHRRHHAGDLSKRPPPGGDLPRLRRHHLPRQRLRRGVRPGRTEV